MNYELSGIMDLIEYERQAGAQLVTRLALTQAHQKL
jgi:hypothetical protein